MNENVEFAGLAENLGLHGTFSPNKLESVHRWYPYLEGFSSTFVEDITRRWANRDVSTIYDPFGGTGTAITVAAVNGIRGLYSEINPFMRHVIECKTNVLRRVAKRKPELATYFGDILDGARSLEKSEIEAKQELAKTFPGRPYFRGRRLIEILALRESIAIVKTDDDFKLLGQLALASIGVTSSEMKRQADLRYRTEKELLSEDYSVYAAFKDKSNQIVNDISPEYVDLAESFLAGANAVEQASYEGEVDLIVTSPPYLNGTNYFRNTKIELWLSGYIQHESELGKFTQAAMIAGINNVSKASRTSKTYPFVEEIASQLDEVAYDKRIPALVRGYCSDTELWIANCLNLMKPQSRLVIDIGDSRFAGVHVPTHDFIIQIAVQLGLEHIYTEKVRERHSKDGTKLKQVLLVFEKPAE
jgi:DNA modification methylase